MEIEGFIDGVKETLPRDYRVIRVRDNLGNGGPIWGWRVFTLWTDPQRGSVGIESIISDSTLRKLTKRSADSFSRLTQSVRLRYEESGIKEPLLPIVN